MKRLAVSLVMCLAFVAFLAPNAFSDTVTFTGASLINGTGIGNTINVLSLQQPGGGTSELGSITPTGTTGDAKPSSSTWTSEQLSDLGLNATNLGIVFNPNETGPNDTNHVYVQSFSLDFYNAAGDSQGSAILTNPQTIVPLSTGTGSSGLVISYNNTTGLLTNFFANPDWILGASGAINFTDDGPDNFYLVNLQNPTAPIPEPSALLLLGSGLVGLAFYGRKTFKR